MIAARALHTRRGRRAASAFLVEGPRAASAAIDSGADIREAFVTDAAAGRDVAMMRALAKAGIPIHTVTERAMAAVAETITPQGVVIVVATPAADALPSSPGLVAVLDRCSDPGNVGTVIRTADAAGADAVVVAKGSVDVWSGKCVRASAGSVLHLPVLTSLETAAAVTALRVRGCRILAAAADGEIDLDDLASGGDLAGPTAWVFGNEAHGLDPALVDRVDGVVRIPLHGRAESLNLAAAAAVCLYASAHARRKGPPAGARS